MCKGKRNGYGISLYRSADNNWIAGVCGGIAENLGWPVWLVRLGAFMLFSITGMLAVFAYLVAVFMLEKREPGFAQTSGSTGHTLKDTVFRYQNAPGQQAKDLHNRMKNLDQRLRSMETYVTSKKYQFDQELKRS